ncbi:lysine--tRNA ligase [Candidatus Micrarchaeota archaeon CG1_02_51_15]|nr:MAG: lysine--tRNA ligase [Candidatus Micrarchaeota archaeon CG1_02_51_15]
MHWADSLAEQIVARSKAEGRTPNVKCQQTPSGGKHIGNLNDVLRAWFPVKAVREMGLECEFVHTTDDRDPLKDVPARIADLDAKWHDSKQFPEIGKYLGRPLCRVPDPFGCCKSWSEHFTEVWMRGVYSLDCDPELYSLNQLYESGKMEPFVRMMFEKAPEAGKLAAKFQSTKAQDYLPFDVICPECGVLTPVDSFDLDNKTVHFTCGGKSIKKKKAEGCGFVGDAPWSEGKLQWRFEWPALMSLFRTTFEPFGKDHAEGSWKSVLEIMPAIYGTVPPIPFVYEFFMVNGEKMSASKGNVYVVQDMLKLVEKEVFNFFYVKRPEKQRDLELSRVFQLADEFDEAERVYFGKAEARTENREENARRMYELAVSTIPEKQPVRVSYSFAAALIQVLDENAALEKLRQLGHLDGASDEDEESALNRLRLAKNWVESFAADEFKIRILPWQEASEKYVLLSEGVKRALTDFAGLIEAGKSEAEQTSAIKSLCAERGVSTSEFFKAAYAILLGRERGPRLVSFANALDCKLVAQRLSGKG